MSLTLPLAVRLATARADRHVTRKLRDLAFRIVAPGGFASVQMSLDEPLTGQPDWLDYYGRAYVYDARTGATLCEGRLEDPGRSAGRDGQVWDLVAVGPAAHARDRSAPVIYADRQIESTAWRQADLISGQAKGSVSYGDGTSNVATLRVQWDSGQSIPPSNVLSARYVRLADTGQWVARVGASHVEGAASTVLKVEVVPRWLNGYVGTGTPNVAIESDNWTTSSAVLLQRYGNEHTSKFNGVDLRLRQAHTVNVTSGDNYWTNLTDVHVLGSRYLRDGTEKTSGYTTSTVLASEVVEDLLGRLLPLYDGVNATVDATSHAISQLAYPDGVDAATVLDDLMELEPGYLWEALESNSAGKYRFAWRQWPTSVRYEADVRDGYDGPGSAAGLYNEVTVRWRDVHGQTRTVRVTQDVPVLTAAGLTRSPRPLDLGDNVGSDADATRAGEQFLAEHRYPPNAGRLRIARPILDLQTGRMVAPWEIRPGYLIRVRGVLPRVDALNATARDGLTVFKIAAVDFRASDAAATLDLDAYAASTARALADLLNRPNTRRR